jgi:hypothetical protein
MAYRVGSLLMNGLGDQLLPGAALARDHDRGVAFGDLADGVEHLEEVGALADDAFEATLGLELALQIEVFVAQPLALERVRDDQLDLVQLERLGDVVVGAELHGLDGRLGGREGGDDEDGRVG